jgi:phospholipase C
VADAGYQAFSAINTANCQVIQTYNVDDLAVPGDPGDTDYTGTDEGIALSGHTLWFAVTGTSNVAAIDISTLDATNYNPAETLIPVGLFPQALAVTPDGHQVWVADTGPQTLTSHNSGVSVINTTSDKVVASLPLAGNPTDVAFSPSGAQAYVTTSQGLYVFDTATRQPAGFIAGLGDPESVAVAPDGKAVYVTETSVGKLAVVIPTTFHVSHTMVLGQLPWQAVVSSDSKTVYVADPDSDALSVVNASTRVVTNTITIPGDPDAVALSPDGSQLWVGDDTSGSVTVVDTATDAAVGQIDLGGTNPQSGDGLGPAGLVLTSTPTAGS